MVELIRIGSESLVFEDFSLTVFLLLVISHNEPSKRYKLNRTNCNSLLNCSEIFPRSDSADSDPSLLA